ncbi:apoptosis antagonizing transcription factor-domain-containing protein [Fomes fomentarius]|nr:apoptosis antagonizing transcription factor-domain-containing protein [Fomes fomentarius]
MAARLSLKDQLAQLQQPAPIDLDPEDALAGIHPQEHRLSIDHPAATEHYIDVAPSALRKLHESVSDPKYDAVPISRERLYDDSEDESVQEHQDQDEIESTPSHPGNAGEYEELNEEEDEESQSQPEDNAFGSASDNETPQFRTPAARTNLAEAALGLGRIDIRAGSVAPGNIPQPEGDIASNLRITHEADKKKGRAVSRQIAIWDTLLDGRIQLQKAVSAANRLPLPDDAARYASHPDARETLDSLVDVAGSLAEELFSLQEDLLRLNETIEAPARKRRKLEATSTPVHEYGSGLQELSSSASALEASYHTWLVDTLSKWSAKVQAVAPNVLLPDNRGSFMRDGKPSQVGLVSLIDDIFRSDGTKLLDRTRKRKDKHGRIGAHREAEEGDEEERVDGEVFEDTDYYQQLLRDVLAARGGDGQGVEQQWQLQQRERRAKRKKAVDTKASKGRKLRYEVHAKVQNFMVPVPVVGGDWHEEQIDGLFSSLLQS